MLTKDQIEKLMGNEKIQATIKDNKQSSNRRREVKLMLLGYNQALLEYGLYPEFHTYESWKKIIEAQKAALEIFRE